VVQKLKHISFVTQHVNKNYNKNFYGKNGKKQEKTGIGGSSVKIYLIHKYGHKCSICGLEKWRDEKVPLVLDHIDGNADNKLLINLRLICRNCDGLLPTYTGRNVGKGKSIERSKLFYKTYSKRKFN
jgi:hypothetical protein